MFEEDLFAVWCSVLQCGAVCCSVLQCVAVCCSVDMFEEDLPDEATQLQAAVPTITHTATHRNTPQHTATHCNTLSLLLLLVLSGLILKQNGVNAVQQTCLLNVKAIDTPRFYIAKDLDPVLDPRKLQQLIAVIFRHTQIGRASCRERV